VSWGNIKAVAITAALMLTIAFIGNWGWEIIVGSISVVIILAVYIIARLIAEYPDDDSDA
jgi:hypothetical protein